MGQQTKWAYCSQSYWGYLGSIVFSFSGTGWPLHISEESGSFQWCSRGGAKFDSQGTLMNILAFFEMVQSCLTECTHDSVRKLCNIYTDRCVCVCVLFAHVSLCPLQCVRACSKVRDDQMVFFGEIQAKLFVPINALD